MRIRYAVMACVIALVLGGCGSGANGGQPGAEGTVVGQPSGGDQSATGPDSPEAGDQQASADLPSLPIGGQAEFSADTASLCATVAFNWNGTLPPGVVIEITGLTYPTGVRENPSASCVGAPCLRAPSFTPDRSSCVVGLTWDGTAPGDDNPVITASGKAVCESQVVCDQVQSGAASTQGEMGVTFPDLSQSSQSSQSSESSESSESSSESS